MINARDWYWNVAGKGLYSSARNVFVPADDAGFVAWSAVGLSPPAIESEADLWSVLWANAPGYLPDWLFDGEEFVQPAPDQYSPAQLRAYAAKVRYEREAGGIVVGGFPVRTDRESQSLVNGAYTMAVRNPAFVTQWKTGSGSFIALDADMIAGVATAVAQHVARVFAIEASVSVKIGTGEVTTLDQIDVAFA